MAIKYINIKSLNGKINYSEMNSGEEYEFPIEGTKLQLICKIVVVNASQEYF